MAGQTGMQARRPAVLSEEFTREEYLVIRNMVTADEYRHIPGGTTRRPCDQLVS